MICEGPEEQLDKFLRDIDIREETPTGIRVEVMEKKEILIDFPLPLRFAPTEVEELRDISRKLDKGVESLKKIEGSVSLNTELTAKNTEILQDINNSLPQRIAQALKDVLK